MNVLKTATTQRIMRTNNRKYSEFGTCLSLVLIGVFRIWRLSRYDLFYDEAISLYEAVHWKNVFSGYYVVHPPLFLFLIRLWTVFFDSVFGLRVFSYVLGMISVLLLFRIAHRIGPPRFAWMTLWLYGFAPFPIYYSREVRNYALLNMLFLCSWYVLLKVLEKPNRRTLVTLAVVNSLLLYTHYYSIFSLLGQMWIILSTRSYRIPLKSVFSAYLVSFVSFLPWLPWMFWVSHRFMHQGHYIIPDLNVGMIGRSVRCIIGGYEAPSYLADALCVIYFFLMTLCVSTEKMKRRLLMGMLFIPLVICIMIGIVNDYNYLWPRFFVFLCGPIILGIASGLQKLKSPYQYVLFVVIIGLQLLSLSFQYRNQFNNIYWGMGVRPKKEWLRSSQFIADHFREGDVIGHTCLSSYLPYWYYLNYTKNHPHGVLIDINRDHWDFLISQYATPEIAAGYGEFICEWRDLISGQKRLWIVGSDWDIDEWGSFFTEYKYNTLDFFMERYRIVYAEPFYGVAVYLFDLESAK